MKSNVTFSLTQESKDLLALLYKMGYMKSSVVDIAIKEFCVNRDISIVKEEGKIWILY